MIGLRVNAITLSLVAGSQNPKGDGGCAADEPANKALAGRF
jgi:hypothetical protein